LIFTEKWSNLPQSVKMTMTAEPRARRPLRLWPGIAAAAVVVLGAFVIPAFVPETRGTGILIGVAGSLLIFLWWLFLSRAPWLERLGVIVLIVAALAATSRVVHASIANGMMGFMLYVYGVPVIALALVAWVAATRATTGYRRPVSIVAAIVLACSAFTLIRTDGITGDAAADFEWRWTPTAEEQLLAERRDEPAPAPVQSDAPSIPTADGRATSGSPAAPVKTESSLEPPLESATAEWPGFRGRHRDGVVRGVTIATDWSTAPPVAMWRRPIGPGWSSFAVDGSRFYTQEQRGEEELVSAYDIETGAPVWMHRDHARFWESNAGAGPRGTPALGHGRVYTVGATGILNALDARTGAVVWMRNAVTDTQATIPDWGIASSPLVFGDAVIAAAAGSLAAYDAASGKPRWVGAKDGWGYASPHALTIDGVDQIALLNGAGAIGVAPSDGALLWKYDWPSDGMLQPAVVGGGEMLIASGSGLARNTGMRRIAIARASDEWKVTDRWTSTGLKPYFNDVVVHKGHAFGFDGSILACIDVADGVRKWKGGRYGHGQLLLLADQDLLLVLSEEGELALVRAAPDQFTEVARVPGIEGKTWNHPVLVGDVLLVRNGEQMAAFRLPRTNR
jgi:outer membrane protein assembly factor BamB